MSEIKDIVNVVITRQTQTISRAGFGVFGIIAEFATTKTNTTFTRSRVYGSLTEMVDDGWSGFDAVYKAAQKLFSQNPNPGKVFIGRKDSGDATWDEALSAIKDENNDWYGFAIVDKSTMTITFSEDLVTDNVINGEINGITLDPVTFSTDQETTMGLLKAEVEAKLVGSTFTVGTTPFRTATVTVPDTYVSFNLSVTGGASQPSISYVSVSDVSEQDIKDVAAWTETERKLFFYNSVDTDILDISEETDIAYFLKNAAYDRTIGMYYKEDGVTNIETAWAASCLPFDPGSQTWAYKTLAGISAYNLTAGQRNSAIDKNINFYTTTGGVNITEEGKVASGEWIDVMRGVDWLQARLQEDVYALLVNSRKIPFTDSGITIIEGAVKAVLLEAASQGILVEDSIVLTVPKAGDVSAADKGNRLLPDVNFTADLQGAIHKVSINGIVSL